MGWRPAHSIGGGITFITTACLSILAAAAQAQPQAERAVVSTQIDDCVPLDRERFHRLLKIELGTTIEYVTQGVQREQTARVASISLTCVPGGVQLLLEDRLTRKSMRRVIALEHIAPQSRSRLMALTAAEFVFASWLELRLPKPMAREVLEPAEPAPPLTAQRGAARALEDKVPALESIHPSWQLAAAVELMAFTSAFRLIPCIALRLAHALSPAVGLQLALQAGRANLPGQLAGQTASVELTTTSLLAAVTYTGVAGDFELYVGGGARFGFVYVAGAQQITAPADGGSWKPVGSYAPWAGAAIVMGANLRAGEHARILLGFEAGALLTKTIAVADTVVVNAPPVIELEHAWGVAYAGAGWAF
jgi:hypothetical protein